MRIGCGQSLPRVTLVVARSRLLSARGHLGADARYDSPIPDTTSLFSQNGTVVRVRGDRHMLVSMSADPAHRRQLGELLVEKGVVTDAQLQVALAEQEASGAPLGEILVRLGFTRGSTIGNALAEQHGGPLRTEYGLALGPTQGGLALGQTQGSAMSPEQSMHFNARRPGARKHAGGSCAGRGAGPRARRCDRQSQCGARRAHTAARERPDRARRSRPTPGGARDRPSRTRGTQPRARDGPRRAIMRPGIRGRP